MRKRTIFAALLLAAAFALTQCSAQAEESTDDLTMEEQAARALFFQLGLVDLGGIYWEGPATINSCTAGTIEASAYCGTMITQGAQIQQETVAKNFRLVYNTQQGPSVTARLYLVTPHFNGYPFGYEILMSGTVSQTTNIADYQVDLTQTSVSVNPNPGYNLAISSFRIDKKDNAINGSFKVTLSSASVNGDAILEYNLTATRGY